MERTTTSPPSLVFAMAALNDRQGAGTVQEAASFPESETAVRLNCPNAAETAKRKSDTICEALMISSDHIVGIGTIEPEVSVVFPSTKLCPPDRSAPPLLFNPVPFLVIVIWMVVRGQALEQVVAQGQRLPTIGTGRFNREARREAGGGIKIIDASGFTIGPKQLVNCVARRCFHRVEVCDAFRANQNGKCVVARPCGPY